VNTSDGGHPDDHKGGFITQEIFDNYHNKLYPGVKNYTQNYVLATAEAERRIHLAFGFYLNTDKPEKQLRSLHNATCQTFSQLTSLAMHKMHILIDKAGYSNDILCISSVYDSIYYEVENDPVVVKWLNDTLIEVMTQDYMHNQRIKNAAEMDIGPDWKSLTTLPNNATLDQITQVMEKL
jgi:hypothetical protein